MLMKHMMAIRMSANSPNGSHGHAGADEDNGDADDAEGMDEALRRSPFMDEADTVVDEYKLPMSVENPKRSMQTVMRSGPKPPKTAEAAPCT